LGKNVREIALFFMEHLLILQKNVTIKAIKQKDMKAIVKEGLLELGTEVYRWRYDSQSGFFSLSSLNESRLLVKNIAPDDFESLSIEELVEQELRNLGILQLRTPHKFIAPKISFTRVEKPEQVIKQEPGLDILPVEVLWIELRKALKGENYEGAIAYRNELIKRGHL
jgi:hypothetical protein